MPRKAKPIIYKECPICGKQILPIKGSYKVTCGSKECISKIHSGSNNACYKGKITCYCKQCGKEFTEYPSRIKDGRGIYCSRECHVQWQRENSIPEEMPWYKGGLTPAQCSWCGSTVMRRQYLEDKPNNYFCSKQCESEWAKIHRTGYNSPRFNGGINKYGYHYTFHRQDIKGAIIATFDYRCFICGSIEDLDNDRFALHHVDIDKKDIPVGKLPNGLMCLCAECHRKMHSTDIKFKRLWKRKFIEYASCFGGWKEFYKLICEQYNINDRP